MNEQELKNILEAILFAADHPLTINQLLAVFPEESQPERDVIKQVLATIRDEYAQRSIDLKEVGSGYRFQVKQDYADWVSKLWEEKPARYSRATLETMALIAYRQPITRAEIEEVRGVSVSTQIIKTLTERDWIKVVGHRDVPGKPALYATTRTFLDYFNLKSLEELPSLAEIRDIDSINAELDLEFPQEETSTDAEATIAVEVARPDDDDADAITAVNEEAREQAEPDQEPPLQEPLTAEN